MGIAVMGAGVVPDATRWFYVWMAGACALIAIVGFAPTYWLQLAPGTFVGSPLLHLHGWLFSAWTVAFPGTNDIRGDGAADPPPHLGLGRHLTRDRNGARGIRGCR